MSRFPKFRRYVRIAVTSADPTRILSWMSTEGIVIVDVIHVDILTIHLTISNSDYTRILEPLILRGCNVTLLSHEGLFWHSKKVLKRPVLLIGIALFLLVAFILPNRILFVTVEGNSQIPDKLILEQVMECGITFGGRTRNVRSEDVKNLLLSKNEMLQWIGVDIKGCTLTIRVLERSLPPEKQGREGISSVIAATDGIISSITVAKGTPMCTTGQFVRQGEVLISGYTDLGLMISAGSAEGEVYAYTLRNLDIILPEPTAQKMQIQSVHTCITLKIGKKLIKLCNHSGIQYATCDKMYSEKYVELPGGFQLPMSIIVERNIFREQSNSNEVPQYARQWLEDFPTDYLRQIMVAGHILSEDASYRTENGCTKLTGTYICEEMIGQVRYEETTEQYAEDN